MECLATADGWWFHLRRCAACGHVGCCDSSPSQHASRHAAEAGHPIVRSYEPDEEWFWDYVARNTPMDRGSCRPSRTRASSRCRVRRAACPETGSATSTEPASRGDPDP